MCMIDLIISIGMRQVFVALCNIDHVFAKIDHKLSDFRFDVVVYVVSIKRED